MYYIKKVKIFFIYIFDFKNFLKSPYSLPPSYDSTLPFLENNIVGKPSMLFFSAAFSSSSQFTLSITIFFNVLSFSNFSHSGLIVLQ